MKPVLVKKALPRHWSKDFDTVEEAMREAQAARMASKRELGNIEDIPITPGTLEWELGLTRDGKARSLIPGVSRGRVLDQGLVDQGGAFAYPALRQSFFPSLHPQVMGRRAGVPLGRGSENMMMFTTEKPRLHATQKEGREQTEAFYPGGFDPAQTYLLSDPTKTFRRVDLEQANRAFMGRNESNYAEGTEGADTPVGRIVAPMSNLVNSTQNPLTVQPWGRPQTVEDVFQLSEPMDIAMRLLKEESQGQLYNEDLFEGFLGADDLIHYDEMNDKQRAIIDAKMALPPHLFTEGSEMGEYMNPFLFSRSMYNKIPDYHYDDELEYLQHYKDAMESGNFVNDNEKTRLLDGNESHPEHPHSVAMSRMHPDFKNRIGAINRLYKASEPMEIAMQLLKERVSPEAKRHKLEYDKKYESSPERVKYREDLNRERRRRGIYGSHDHKDISHTEGGKLTLEGEHENRARHFKDKGTLREL